MSGVPSQPASCPRPSRTIHSQPLAVLVREDGVIKTLLVREGDVIKQTLLVREVGVIKQTLLVREGGVIKQTLLVREGGVIKNLK